MRIHVNSRFRDFMNCVNSWIFFHENSWEFKFYDSMNVSFFSWFMILVGEQFTYLNKKSTFMSYWYYDYGRSLTFRSNWSPHGLWLQSIDNIWVKENWWFICILKIHDFLNQNIHSLSKYMQPLGETNNLSLTRSNFLRNPVPILYLST